MADVHATAYKHKFEKREVGYEHPACGEDHCGACAHFEVEARKTCEIVRGVILSEDWCKKWKAKKS